MMATTGAASRLAATAAGDLDREIEAIVRALEEHGPVDDDELERLVGARYRGPDASAPHSVRPSKRAASFATRAPSAGGDPAPGGPPAGTGR